MKTQKLLFGAVSLIAVVLFAGCGSKDSNNGNPAVQQGYMSNGVCYGANGQPTSSVYCNNQNSGYYMSNGICYGPGGVQSPNPQLCYNNGGMNGGMNSGYYMSNGICYGPGGVQAQNPQLCYNNGGMMGGNMGGNMGGMMGQQCMGPYYYTGYGVPQVIYCTGQCHNVMLYTQYGQPVYCQ